MLDILRCVATIRKVQFDINNHVVLSLTERFTDASTNGNVPSVHPWSLRVYFAKRTTYKTQRNYVYMREGTKG